MSSARLPGKTLADVRGEPMLSLVLGRLKRARELERVVVATSSGPEDDRLAQAATELGAEVYRGALEDVLARFVGAAAGHSGPLVRVTADCPLIDPAIVDDAVRLFRAAEGCAYASNLEPRSYPVGLDVEVFSAAGLKWAARAAQDAEDREHVTPILRRHRVELGSVTLLAEEQFADLRWTVDTAEDLEFVRRVVARLGRRRYVAGFSEILAAVRQEPSLAGFHGRRG